MHVLSLTLCFSSNLIYTCIDVYLISLCGIQLQPDSSQDILNVAHDSDLKCMMLNSIESVYSSNWGKIFYLFLYQDRS